MSEPTGVSLRIVAGQPTPEEVAAVVVALTGLAAAHTPRPGSPARVAGWSAYWRTVGAPPPPGPDSWRRSGRPG